MTKTKHYPFLKRSRELYEGRRFKVYQRRCKRCNELFNSAHKLSTICLGCDKRYGGNKHV